MKKLSIHIIFSAAFVLLVAFALADDSPIAAGQLRVDVELLKKLPVNHDGMIKSFNSFAHEEVEMITGKRQWEDLSPVDMTLSMMWQPERWIDKNLIRIDQKDLRAIFGKKRISPLTFSNPDTSAKIRALYAESDKSLKEAIETLTWQADTAANLERAWKVIPYTTDVGDLSFASPVDFETAIERPTPRQRSMLTAARDMRTAWLAGNEVTFNSRLRDMYRMSTEELGKAGVKKGKIGVDNWYTSLRPFARAGYFYLIALVLFSVAYLLSRPSLNKVAVIVLLVGFLINVAALIMRGYIAGRVPVSNFFESFTFAIAGIVGFSLFFQWVFRRPVIGIAGAALGFIFMGVASSLPVHMQQVTPLMPALQSYWLNIHVTTMLLSYAIFAVAFVIGLIYLIQHFRLNGFSLKGGSDDEPSRLSIKIGDEAIAPDENAHSLMAPSVLELLNFKLISIGLAMLTAGVILGAVWADTAWGRPWGWDPKETWAAITWGVYAFFVHLNLFGKWRGAPAVLVSTVGFMCVIFTYIGVSFFLAGLHSYA